MRASRTDSHSPNIRLRIIQTLQSSIFQCRGQTLITGENSLPYWAGHITAPNPQLVCRNATSGDQMRYQKASRSMCRGRNFPGSQESPMSADQNTLFNLSLSLEQDWINTATFLFYGVHFCPNLVCGQLIHSSDWPQCKWPISVCTELIQLLSEPLPFHYNAIAHCTIHRALGILQMRF